MSRKLTVILISALISLLGTTSVLAKQGSISTWQGLETGTLPETYSEAPMLRVKVAAGELPPVEERLPDEPLVMKPVEEIGQYGGTLYQASVGPGGFYSFWWAAQSVTPGQYNNQISEIMPNMVKGFELTNGAKTVTIHLREGMKWSDGYPFTVDDILFRWEDQSLNEELSPQGPRVWWKPGGEPARFEKVDDYTLKIHFVSPNPPILNILAEGATQQTYIYDPKHYLKKWHIDYNPDADKLAQEEGYDHWWEAFKYHKAYLASSLKDLDLPTIAPWVLEEVQGDGTRIYERNPYFWMVDTAGNQLPYMDRMVVFNMSDSKSIELKAVAGEISYIDYMLTMKNYPLYVENAEASGYRVITLESYSPSGSAFTFNLNHKNPVLRKIFQDVRFRQAMSLAIDREAINEAFYYGMGTPAQTTVHKGATFFKQEWADAYVQYDPEEANRLLDEMGLDKKGADGYRLGPDGKRPIMLCELVDEADVELAELVEKYWSDVGVKVDFKAVGRPLYLEHIQANEFDVNYWQIAKMTEAIAYGPNMWLMDYLEHVAPLWSNWRLARGEAGEEPPEEWKELFETFETWISSDLSKEEYIQMAQEIFDFFADNLVYIGTVGYAPVPVIVSDNLRNVPEYGYFGGDAPMSLGLFGVQFFFKQ